MNPYIIKKPLITEKSITLAQTENKYTFVVDRLANKDQIRVAIEEMFKVKIIAINTIRSYRAKKTTGRKRLKTVMANTKKAIVKLKKGQTIDLFELSGSDQDNN
jgi:large subunit ribosomal protein L23